MAFLLPLTVIAAPSRLQHVARGIAKDGAAEMTIKATLPQGASTSCLLTFTNPSLSEIQSLLKILSLTPRPSTTLS